MHIAVFELLLQQLQSLQGLLPVAIFTFLLFWPYYEGANFSVNGLLPEEHLPAQKRGLLEPRRPTASMGIHADSPQYSYTI